MKALLLVLVALLVATGGAASDDPWGDLKPGPFEVGFRLLEETDPSRAIRPGGSSARTYPRPIRVYLWYPASLADGAKPMAFGRYAELADEDVWPDEILSRARGRMAFAQRPLARSLGPERYEELLALPVRAVEDVPPVARRFPLIVIGQGLYYESPISHAILSELLASHGFVVATCPLVGTHSPFVRIDVVNLETQVRDMEFVIAQARDESFVDTEKLGLFGFDMGGMAAVVLAMRNPDVDAFASLDAGILFDHPSSIPSGIPFTSPHFDPRLLRIPWLHGTQRRNASPAPGSERSSLFDDAESSERYLVLIDEMRHADFTSYALVEDKAPIRGYWPPEKGGEKARYEAVISYVSSFFRAYLSDDAASHEFLLRDPGEAVPGIPLTVEHRSPTPPGPVDSNYSNALLTGDIPAAKEISSTIRKARSDSPLLDETALIRLGYHLLSSWGMSDEGIEVFRLYTEVHPQSASAWSTLGDGYLWIEDREQARRCFRKVLELEPENDRAKRILGWLESSPE